jgi:hypothetical protein
LAISWLLAYIGLSMWSLTDPDKGVAIVLFVGLLALTFPLGFYTPLFNELLSMAAESWGVPMSAEVARAVGLLAMAAVGYAQWFIAVPAGIRVLWPTPDSQSTMEK